MALSVSPPSSTITSAPSAWYYDQGAKFALNYFLKSRGPVFSLAVLASIVPVSSRDTKSLHNAVFQQSNHEASQNSIIYLVTCLSLGLSEQPVHLQVRAITLLT